MQLNMKTIVKTNEQILTTPIDNDMGLMDIEKGYYYTLDEIGRSVWEKIQNQTTIEDVVNQLVREYDANSKVCMDDVIELLSMLEVYQLIKVWN